jgi:uncharacterized FAD-dependent dehydrogenase
MKGFGFKHSPKAIKQPSLRLQVIASASNNKVSWRLFDVSVPVSIDPGKDDYRSSIALADSVAKALRLSSSIKLNPDDLTIIRKSFDARKYKSTRSPTAISDKKWNYVVEIGEEALIKAAGPRSVKHFKPQPGKLEKIKIIDNNNNDNYDGNKPTSTGTTSSSSSSSSSKTDINNEQLPIVIVGAGPAGLFAALELAEAGITNILLLERGQPVDIRGRDIGALFVRRQLNSESNLCYGEGGAGTWSDGKLTTRIGRNSDPVRRVLSTLYELGAPEGVLFSGKPHLGTDRLVRILKGFRERLGELGVKMMFDTKITDLMVSADNYSNRIKGVVLSDGSVVRARKVIMAVGHSARDVYVMLYKHGVQLTPKPFSVGFRIEHPQSFIDSVQYGEEDAGMVMRGKGVIPVADYRLAAEIKTDTWGGGEEDYEGGGGGREEGNIFTTNASKRGVYSFCMCPGGQIVPTSTSPDLLCINGMSFSKRDGKWANSALVVTVGPEDFYCGDDGEQGESVKRILKDMGMMMGDDDEDSPLTGVAYQMHIEKMAAQMGGGGGDFVAPAQRVCDYLEDRMLPSSSSLPPSSYRLGTKSAPLHQLYAPPLTAAFKQALLMFDKKMKGFATGPHGLLLAAETRTSSPVRVERGEDSMESLSMRGLFPCGEGAGYAGGIVSAAVDGLKVARAIAREELDIDIDDDGGGSGDDGKRRRRKMAVPFGY